MTAFETPAGHLVPAITADEMREIDRVAVENMGLGLLQMMENAGRNLAEYIHNSALQNGSVVVLAGPGGNGGGGLCCARHLANHGVSVEVLLDRNPRNLRGAALQQFDLLDAMNVPLLEKDDTTIENALMDASFVVDALIGYGLHGAPRGRVAELIERCEATATRTLSLDVPSGLQATSGETPGAAVTPDATLTLALPKTGLVAVSGDIFLSDIAIPPVVYERVGIEYESPFDGHYWIPLQTTGKN